MADDGHVISHVNPHLLHHLFLHAPPGGACTQAANVDSAVAVVRHCFRVRVGKATGCEPQLTRSVQVMAVQAVHLDVRWIPI